ncbi:MAG: MBL fold metallo-hydrolase [Sphingomonadaceae bacterium]
MSSLTSCDRLGLGLVVAAMIANCAAAPASAETFVVPPVSFVTLGTNSGALPNPDRMQPANVLLSGDHAILIDVGDGAAAQLSKVGVSLGQVDAVLISHHHFDHTGGLFAFMSQRFQVLVKGSLHIYGPPGTEAMVGALCNAIKVGQHNSDLIAYGGATPCTDVIVTDLSNGGRFSIGDVKITVAANSHYTAFPSKPPALSLSYRFDTHERSIVYTGDTGPSANIERLSEGADLLVAEIMDPDIAIAEIVTKAPNLPEAQKVKVEAHFRLDHLSPIEVAAMAKRAGVKGLVLTHNALADDDLPSAQQKISHIYDGVVVFARDLDRF